jgi:DNA-binding transcriptional LysR family regulator
MNRPSARRVRTRLKTHHLQVVAALHDSHSVTKAAEALSVSRAALSKTLVTLEEMLGGRLYERTALGMKPTPLGDALARHARLVLADLLAAEDEVFDILKRHSERISLGAFFSTMPLLVPSALARLMRERPSCLVTVVEGDMPDLIDGLMRGVFDLVVGRIVAEYVSAPIEAMPLYEEGIFAVCRVGHKLAGRRRVSWREAVMFPWILPPRESPVHETLRGQLRADATEAPAAILEGLSTPLTLGLVVRSDSIGLLPERIARQEQERQTIAILPLVMPRLPAPVGIAWRGDKAQSPLAVALIAALRDCAAQSLPDASEATLGTR